MPRVCSNIACSKKAPGGVRLLKGPTCGRCHSRTRPVSDTGADLTRAQIKEIKASEASAAELAHRYGLSTTTVELLKRGSAWACCNCGGIEATEAAHCYREPGCAHSGRKLL